ncbi:DUF6418 domain-containing protein [Serratia fonticola]|uniref:DUF6418 domain-containing protein n=1 Tax=Serratia fonticola TaxID=47917 RepID=UPI0024DE2855|nr:DUF6418 domain-containing protein [Serratia fonticola]
MIIKRNTLIASFFLLVCGFLLLTATILDDYFVLIGVTGIFLLVLFFISFYKIEQSFFILLIPFSIPHISAIISNVFIETGTYVEELKQFSYATGGTIRLVFFMITFFLTARFVYAFLLKFEIIDTNNSGLRQVPLLSEKIIIWLSLTLIIILLLGALIWGTPLGNDEQRFDFWSAHPFPQFRGLLYQGYQLAFVLGVLIPNGFYKRIMSLLIIAFCLMNVLYGEKFTGIFLTCIYFIVGYTASVNINKFQRISFITMKKIIITLFILLLVFGIIFYQYKYVHKIDGSIIGFITMRIFALQGEVWWAIDSIFSKKNDISNIEYLLFSGNGCKDYGGLYYMMSKITSASLVSSYCERGVTFTMGYPAILISTVGYLSGWFINIFFGSFVGVTLYLIRKIIINGSILGLYVSAKVLLIETHAFNMGNLFNIIDFNFIFYFILLFVLTKVRFKYV